jgi:hypothetical protein
MIVVALRTDGNQRYNWMKNRRSLLVNTSISGNTRCAFNCAARLRVFIDDAGKVHRSGGQRSHVGLQVKRAAARRWISATTPGRELDDDARTMLADPLLHPSEQRRIGRRTFVGITYMDVHERSPCLECLMGGFDLLGGGHRNGRIVLF